MIMVKCDWAHDHCDRMPDDGTGKMLIMLKAYLLSGVIRTTEERFLPKVIAVIWCMHHFDADASICIRTEGAIGMKNRRDHALRG